MIPLHPQQVPGRPDRLRWITPADAVTGTGPLSEVPAPLAALLGDGTLTRIELEPAAVVTCLGEGRTWYEEGARVRTALHAALDARPLAAGTDRDHDDALLHRVACEVLDGEVGDFARSHGGTIDLLGVRDGVVTVRLGGACHGCPASWITLHQRLERALRRRHPGVLAVRNATSPGGPGPRRACVRFRGSEST